jgi:hypothetical protein
MLIVLLGVGRRIATPRLRRPPPEHWPQGPDNLGTQPLPAPKDVKP